MLRLSLRLIALIRTRLARTTTSSGVTSWLFGMLCAACLLACPPDCQAQTHLAPGTVPILKGVVSGATVGAPIPIPGGNMLVIDQQLADALIDWSQFNIASGSVVKFVQPNSSAVALNRIFDLSPSILDGKLTANGQIWLINQNGIMFGQGAQVNANTLVASTLNISDSLLANGLTSSSGPTFAGGYAADGTPTSATPAGSIQIGATGGGAAPQIATPAGGTIIMVSPRINNQTGIITAPDGQVILAAGNSVYLAQASSTATPNVRGYVVQITADSGSVNLTSLIANAGAISADRGNVTLAALAVNQGGRVSATSSALYNGTVVLQAQTQSGQGGTVTLLPGSVTETPIDTTDTTKLPAGEAFSGGEVSISGKTIINQGSILAPGGVISMAANDVADPLGSRIYLAPGSVTDAAGDWSSVPYSNTLQTFRVTTNELADAPDQKGGILEGASVTVNLDEPSTILDLSGYQSTQLQSVQQKAAAGGSVNLVSAGSVIARSGSIINVQGGGTNVLSGEAAVTELIGANGQLYNINTAPETLRYVGIFGTYDVDHPRWGTTQSFTYNIGLNAPQPGFVQGAAAGSINVQAGAGAAFDGNVLAGVTVGPNQLSDAPRGGSLTVGSSSASVPDYGIQNVTFTNKPEDSLGASFGPSTALSTQNLSETSLSGTLLTAGGLSSLSVSANSTITVPQGVALSAPIGGTIALTANQINVAGDLAAPSGTIALNGQRTISSAVTQTTGAAAATNPDGAVVLLASSRVNANGVWINTDGVDGATIGPVLPSALRNADASTTSTLAGGSVSISAPTIDMMQGSSVDVSGGGSINEKGKITGGAGGTIAIGASGTVLNDPLHTVETQLTVDSSLSGYSLTTGGSLKVSAPVVSIGAATASAGQTFAAQPAFFTQDGFSSYTITGADALTLAPTTAITPLTTSEVVTSLAAGKLPSGGNLASIASLSVLPANQRPATSVALAVTNPVSAPLVVGAGNAISVDPLGKITLTAVNGLEVNGRLSAPGGTIALTLNGPTVNGTDSPTVPLTIGPKADISTAGTFVANVTQIGIVAGTIESGGTISINSVNGSVASATGSVLDVSGTSQVVDVFVGNGQNKYVPELIGSDAGVLSVAATDGIALNGGVAGKAGTARNAGGSFVLALTDRNNSVLPANDNLPREIIVRQDGSTPLPSDASSSVIADFTVDQLANGGFDKLRLQSDGTIAFAGPVSASFQRGVTLDAPQYLLEDGANVTLKGAEVALINSFGTRQADPNGITNGVNSPFNGSAAPVVPTTTGDGMFNVQAANVDLYGSLTINGAAAVNVQSAGDIRFSGRQVLGANSESATLVGGLTTTADVTFTGSQLYPTTQSDFAVTLVSSNTTALASGVLTIAGNGHKPDEVLSAGGQLALNANVIDQAGIVKAPLGELDLNAGTSLILESGSLTSVSAKGLLIPYGETEAGVQWLYGPTNFVAGESQLNAAPSKLIVLSAPNVVQKSGASIDLAGGGDVFASEFVPGSGGTADITKSANTYVIIPGANFGAAPFDPDILARNNTGTGFSPTQSRDGSIYNTIQIGAGAAVPAGSYTLLPALYAFVPGAYLVQLETGSAYQNLQADSNASLANGASVAAGHLSVAGTGIAQAATVGIVLQPGSAIAKYSDYTITTSDFFTKQALESSATLPITPSDAGSLQIAAVSQLQLSGTFATAAAAGGSAAEVDISASKIALVDQTGNAAIDPSYLQISTGSLSNIDANLLIGGVRTNLPAASSASASVQLTTTASDILVANSAAAPLKAPELILAATDAITVNAGSVLEGTGSVAGRSSNITTDAGSALIRLANSPQVEVTRAFPIDNTTGSIVVQPGALLEADASALFNATKSTVLGGAIDVAAGGALSLTAPNILLGDSGALGSSGNGLALNNAALNSLDRLGNLVMQSTGSIEFFGATELGSGSVNLTLDSASLIGMPGASSGLPPQTQIAANNLVLVNSSATAPASAGVSGGALSVNAASIAIAGGDKSITGFQSVALNATSGVTFSGAGSLYVAGNTTVNAPNITVAGGAQQVLTTVPVGASTTPYNLVIGGNAQAATPQGAGGQLALSANAISDAIPITAKSGTLSLTATGDATTSGIVLQSGAVLDASGSSKSFNGDVISVDAGNISLTSNGAAIAIDAGAQLSVAGASSGSNAGTISVTTPSLTVAGILAGAAPSGFQQGNVTLDLGTLANFSALNTTLNNGGFANSRVVRVRSGDITVASSDDVLANNVTLEADSGGITVAGTIDASAVLGGGSISLFAQNNIDLAPGSLLSVRGTSQDASASAPIANGGSVDLQTIAGQLTFQSGAQIDIRSGAKGSSGSVVFNAPQTMDASLIYDQVPVTLNGVVLSASASAPNSGSVLVEGNRVYPNAAPQASDIAGYGADYTSFVQNVNAASIISGLKSDGGSAVSNAQVTGAIEIQSSGDMEIDSVWDLTGAAFSTGAPSMLTLRAAGDLTVNGQIGLPNTNLPAAPSWSLRLVGGADLTAADPMAVQSLTALAGSGNVLLPNATSAVRTGTGSIQIAAGTDFNLSSPTAVVYTAGEVAAADGTNGRWASGGGNISITAQQDVLGAESQEWVTDWIRRPTGTPVQTTYNGSWWVYRPDFQQNIGALGGGNIAIDAGGNIVNLSAAIPTSGEVVKNPDGTESLVVYGGGNLSVNAGGQLDGGSYLLGLGTGSIKAAGNIGAVTPPQLYEMGQSSNSAVTAESLTVTAGGSLAIQSVLNPTALVLTHSVGKGPSFQYGADQTTFFTYSQDASVDLIAKSGDVSLGVYPLSVSGLASIDANSIAIAQSQPAVMPPIVAVVALNGNIATNALADEPAVLFPSTDGQLQVLAAKSISNLVLAGSDYAPSALPNWSNAADLNWPTLVNGGNALAATASDALLVAAGTQPTVARIVTRTSSDAYVFDVQALDGNIDEPNLNFPGNARIFASGSIVGGNADGSLSMENLAAGQLSIVQAYSGNIVLDTDNITVGGPGQLVVQAGGSIDLGASGSGPQLFASGSDQNASLPTSSGARLTVVAGVEGNLNTDNLQKALNGVKAAGEETTGTPASHAQQASLSMDQFYGASKLEPGDINSYLTSIQTTGGGGIDLIAPQGNITVGLTSPQGQTQIGVITNLGGAINSFLSGDFTINTGKVVTAQGGDIMIFTSEGNIDAGRGAKTSVTTPAAQRTCNAQGQCAYVLSTGVAGSGIQTVTSNPVPGQPAPPAAGNIFLFAPAGYVNAGEAGITSGGNVFISAQQVLNASNISAAGTSVGVPTVTVGSIAATLAASGSNAAAGTDSAAADAARSAAQNAANNAADQFSPGLITVEVLGFGSNVCKETDKQCLGEPH